MVSICQCINSKDKEGQKRKEDRGKLPLNQNASHTFYFSFPLPHQPHSTFKVGIDLQIMLRRSRSMYIAHCSLHNAHCTLHIAHCTLHNAHCSLHIAHCTLCSAQCALSWMPDLWGAPGAGWPSLFSNSSSECQKKRILFGVSKKTYEYSKLLWIGAESTI